MLHSTRTVLGSEQRAIIQLERLSLCTGPNESVALAGQVEGVGAEYMEAPVLGSRPEADAGALQVFVSV